MYIHLYSNIQFFRKRVTKPESQDSKTKLKQLESTRLAMLKIIYGRPDPNRGSSQVRVKSVTRPDAGLLIHIHLKYHCYQYCLVWRKVPFFF